MHKIMHVAAREFWSTVATKGFIIGVLVTPVILGVMIVVMPMLMHEKAPAVIGEVAIVDPTGEVTAGFAEYLRPETIAERRGDQVAMVREAAPEELRALAGDAGDQTADALEAALGAVPRLEVRSLTEDADVELEKDPLRIGKKNDGGRLALVVIHPDAVVRPSGEEAFGSYDLYIRDRLDDRIEDEIRAGLVEALIDARVRAYNLDRQLVTSLTRVPRVRSISVSATGEKTTNEVVNMLLPAGFMILLLASVFTGGQYLMTSTVEEKSSRVVEVLLAAVSPMELMTGKIVGQMAVGFVVLALYSGMGVATLWSFAMLGVLDPLLIVYLVIFYLIAYFVIAAMMAAIGASVNEMREAQTLMTPVMLIMMVPWLLWMPISRNPDSVFSLVTSFIPPINTFVMLLRLTSSSPPPAWQVSLSIAVGALSVWGALWFAAKVFRIGLLMFGKPPNFKTLIRWVRMA